jgi:hypothetical protein
LFLYPYRIKSRNGSIFESYQSKKRINMYILTEYFSLKSKYLLKIFLITLILFSVAQQNIFAAPKKWNGSVSTDWATAANWTNSGVPGAGDDVTIPKPLTGGRMPTISSGIFSTNNLTIESGATLTQTGGQLTATNTTSISGNFNQQGGTFLTAFTVTVNSGGVINQSSSGVIHLAATLATNPSDKITIDGGTVNAAGTIRVKDLELKNGGTFNQTDGEFVVYHDFKCPTGTTFASTGGTVRLAGSGGPGGPTFQGNIQFHNVVIDSGVDPNFNRVNNQTIRVSGDYTNKNSSLDVTNTTFIFNGSGDQTIYSASTPLPATTTFGSLVIDKPSGSISMLSNVAVANSFTQTSGYLDTNSYTLWVGGTPLPVELSSFSAIVLENAIRLDWRTETEVSNYGFEVLRSNQNDNWSVLGFVQGHGNSNSPKDYSFTDNSVSGGKYSYRLKQIDTDGSFEYSKVIEVDLGSLGKFELSQNYPNPFNPVTTIRFLLSESGNVKLTVYNIVGEQVAVLVDGFREEGVYTINFSAESLPSGLYIYTIDSNGSKQSRKMILAK